LSWNDWGLVFTHINGGKSSGKRNELAMKPSKSSSNGAPEEYLQAALSFAESFGTTKYAPIRQLAVKDDLARMLVVSTRKQGPKPRIMTMKAKRFGEYNTGIAGVMKRLKAALGEENIVARDDNALVSEDEAAGK
jgi:hypothetical protein